MRPLVDFTIEIIRAVIRPDRPHLVIKLVAINTLAINWGTAIHSQMKVAPLYAASCLAEDL